MMSAAAGCARGRVHETPCRSGYQAPLLHHFPGLPLMVLVTTTSSGCDSDSGSVCIGVLCLRAAVRIAAVAKRSGPGSVEGVNGH